MALWTSRGAEAATGGTSTAPWEATGVSIDTRTLAPGDLFVALSAARDGHDFVAAAFGAGAAAALVTHIPGGVTGPCLVVPDVLRGLEGLAVAARTRSGACVGAITGSVGKTSAKEMARAVLSRQGRTHAAEASYNNHWGVPLTLARMPVDTDFAVIEIGMNAPGEIAPLSRLARPHAALITLIAPAHLEAFADLDGIAREKASIAYGLQPGGPLILNAASPCLDTMRAGTAGPVTLFNGGAFTAEDIRLVDDTTIVDARLGDEPVLFKLASPGRHFAANALGVLALAEALGADPLQAAGDLHLWQPPPGRGTRETVVLDANAGAEITLIDDAFNANPSSMAAALEILAAAEAPRRVAILGDMLELGPDEATMHAAIADLPELDAIDLVHLAGPRMAALRDALPPAKRGLHADSARDLALRAHDLVAPGDAVLVKGSKGSEVSRVVDALRRMGQSRKARGGT
ncbi:MAG: UDP-N-acetylmuramoyl-tripeptide--D-alanyl-D-alanine ligase [Shimia sp.]